VAACASTQVLAWDWSVEGSSGSWNAVFDETREAGSERRASASLTGRELRSLSPAPQDSGMLTTLH
jgi:hypothetical protein